MGHIIADEELESRLRGFLEPIEIRDVHGGLLGHYTPYVSPELKEKYEKTRQLFDLDEARRIAATEREGKPLSEVWKRILGQENQQ
jgi:hypothetical protein